MANARTVLSKPQAKATPVVRSRRPRTPAAVAPFTLVRVLGEEGGQWRVEQGAQRMLVELDASVDPELVREAILTGARALLETSSGNRLVGLLQTGRVLTVDRQNRIRARVESFALHVGAELTLQTATAFVRLKGGEVELYGHRVLTRAREVAQVIARLVSFN